MKFLGVASIFFFLLSCKATRHCECKSTDAGSYPVNENIPTTTINLPQLGESFDRYGLYANFGYQFIARDSTVYLSFLNSKKNLLVFVDLFDSTKIVASSTRDFIQPPSRHCNVIVNDTLHLIDALKFRYWKIAIGADFKLHPVDSIDLFPGTGPGRRFLPSNVLIEKRLAYTYPYLVVPYGVFKKRNGMDKKAALVFNVANKNLNDVLEYPAKYLNCDVSEHYPIVLMNRQNLISIFLKSDELVSTNVADRKITGRSDSTDFKSNYMCYDRAQTENLSYSENYDLLDEENFNLIFSNDKYYLVKRLRLADRKATVKCAILVFDKSLKYITTYYPPEAVVPRLSFPCKSGIGIVSASWDKLFIYDI